MAELNFKKLADAPVLESVPDGAKVYAEVEGKVYRVAGDNLGGGVKTAVLIFDDENIMRDGITLEDALALVNAHQPVLFLGCSSDPAYLVYATYAEIDSHGGDDSLIINFADMGKVIWTSTGIRRYEA